MSVIETVKSVLPVADDSGVETTEYVCTDCESTFPSAKSDERVACPDCLSKEVERV
jgi:protein-arginine kinase activator protein McsA